MKSLIPISFLIFASAACSVDDAESLAPAPKKIPVELELHGETRMDDFYWLRDRENPDVVAYLEAQGPPPPAGGSWSPDSFTALMAELDR